MQFGRVSAIVVAGLLLGSCASVGPFIGDNLPVWAGGLPEGTPPRANDPRYNAYRESIRGAHAQPPAGSAPVASSPVAAPPATPKDPVDEPIH